jgi:hypothetical protein
LGTLGTLGRRGVAKGAGVGVVERDDDDDDEGRSIVSIVRRGGAGAAARAESLGGAPGVMADVLRAWEPIVAEETVERKGRKRMKSNVCGRCRWMGQLLLLLLWSRVV